MLRKLKAAAFVRAHEGEVCPASWQPGEETLRPGLELVERLGGPGDRSQRRSEPGLGIGIRSVKARGGLMSATVGEFVSGTVDLPTGATIYHEVRGEGPPVLLIAGAMGDAGLFELVAERLADEFTVITYDRRGNSRSPRPEGWARTDSSEQAADAVALLEALVAGPATVFGTSSGADIALSLALEHPAAACGAVVHEPPILGVLTDPEPVEAQARAVIEPAMASGGPQAAFEAFLRIACGDRAIDAMGSELRERALANGDTFFELEFGVIDALVPDERGLAGVSVQLRPAVSIGYSPPFLHEATVWLAGRLGAPLRELPGGHAGYLDSPDQLAEGLRPLFRELAQTPGRNRSHGG